MKKVCKFTAFILLLATLITSTHLNILIPFVSRGAGVTDYINSSKICDYGQDGSYFELDDTGRLWLYENEAFSMIAELGAELIALDGETLYFSSGDRIHSYNVLTGNTEHVLTAKSDIVSFCASSDAFYYVCADGAYSYKNSKTKMLSPDVPKDNELFESVDPSKPAKIMLESKSRLVFYYENPNYVDESKCEIGVEIEDNTEYIPFVFDIKTSDLTEDISLLISEKEIAESIANADDSYTINGVTLPLAKYPVNSFFTKNGKSCTCHNQGICVEAKSSKGCNCMRYYPSESKCEIDLLSSQCMGFARFCQWVLYGSIDYDNPNYKNAFGSNLESGRWSASKLKTYIQEVGAGGHLRTGSGHSLFVINVNSTGFITYEANKSVWGGMCQVYTRTWTWESFYKKYGAYDLIQYKIPSNVNVGGGDETDPYPVGTYITTAESGLRLRDTYGTLDSTTLAIIPYGSILDVTQIKDISGNGDYWGKTEYNGISGWISLEFAAYQTATIVSISIQQLPNKTTYNEGDKFSTDGLVVEALLSNGTSTQISGYTCSGYDLNKAGEQTVTVAFKGLKATFKITIIPKKIYPSSVKLSDNSIVLLKGDTHKLNYTIYPSDATERDVSWSCNNLDEAYIAFENGEIIARGEWTATITVKTSNGKTDTCKIQIVTLPSGTAWSSSMIQLPYGITTLDYQVQYKKTTSSTWTDVAYGDEVEPKSGYEYRFRRYTLDLIVNGASMPGYPQTTTVGTPLNLSKSPFLLTSSVSSGLFGGWHVHDTENGVWDVCKSQYTVVGDTTMRAYYIPLISLEADHDDPLASGSNISPFTVVNAELYINDNVYGMRYNIRLSKQLISALEDINSKNKPLIPSSSSDKDVGYGSVTIFKSKISSSQLVKGSSSSTYLKNGASVIVPAVNTRREYSNYIIYTALITDYTADYYKTDIAVRPYITYNTCNGITVSFYPTMTGSSTKGGAYYTNLYAVAKKEYETTTDNTRKTWIKENILTDI